MLPTSLNLGLQRPCNERLSALYQLSYEAFHTIVTGKFLLLYMIDVLSILSRITNTNLSYSFGNSMSFRKMQSKTETEDLERADFHMWNDYFSSTKEL